MNEPEPRETASDGSARCPWCAAPTAADATRCPACGAAIAQRESIGDLLIPGLTGVHPALQDFDKRPLHIGGPSPSQGMAPALIAGAVAGGPIGVAAIGGVAAVAAAEYLGVTRSGTGETALEDVGRPSEVVLQALEHLDEGSPATAAAQASEADGAAADGQDIWRDLPEPTVDPGGVQEEEIDGG